MESLIRCSFSSFTQISESSSARLVEEIQKTLARTVMLNQSIDNSGSSRHVESEEEKTLKTHREIDELLAVNNIPEAFKRVSSRYL